LFGILRLVTPTPPPAEPSVEQLTQKVKQIEADLKNDRELLQERLGEEIQKNLDAGRPATLVGNDAETPLYRWATGGDEHRIFTSADGYLSVASWGLGRLELLGDPKQDRYRLSFEVRHEQTPKSVSYVGIYFGYSLVPMNGKVIPWHCSVAFNGVLDESIPGGIPPPPGNNLTLRVNYDLPKGGDKSVAVGNASFIPISEEDPPVWRKFSVDITPETIKILGGDKPVTVWVDRAPKQDALQDRIDKLFTSAKLPLAVFSTRRPLGLYVYHGIASFRNVVIEPLPNPP
jgi:hypothetical protein